MPSPDKRAAARELLAARARRLRTLRRRIAASALATFALAWGVIAWHGSMGAESVAATSDQATVVTSPESTQTYGDQSQPLTTAQS
jgi:hypothetical protein